MVKFIYPIYSVGLFLTFNMTLDAIHKHIEKLVYVHLLEDIHWIALVILEGVCEAAWIVRLFVAL